VFRVADESGDEGDAISIVTHIRHFAKNIFELKITKARIFLNAGLYPISNLYKHLGFEEVINENLRVRTSNKGYSDSEHVLSLILMQIAGGSAVDHLSEFSETFSKEFGFAIPSLTAARDYLNCFHEEAEDDKRGYGRSFVPESYPLSEDENCIHLKGRNFDRELRITAV
jgi:hypothetical protein